MEIGGTIDMEETGPMKAPRALPNPPARAARCAAAARRKGTKRKTSGETGAPKRDAEQEVAARSLPMDESGTSICAAC